MNKLHTSELLSSHQSSIKASQPCVIIDSKTIKDRRLETLVNIYQQNINPMWNWNRQGNVKSIDICVAWSKMLGHLFSNIFLPAMNYIFFTKFLLLEESTCQNEQLCTIQ